METRVITHDENHYDIEALFPVRDDSGLWVDVWAVIYCNENEKELQAPQSIRAASNPGGCIQDLSPVVEAATTKHLEEEMSNAYIIYRGEKVPVSVESYFQGADGMIANVKALSGFPFNSGDVNAQGETSGAWNCNGYRVRTEFVMVEHVPAEAAYQQEFSDVWSDERIDTGLIELNAPYRPDTNGDDLPF